MKPEGMRAHLLLKRAGMKPRNSWIQYLIKGSKYLTIDKSTDGLESQSTGIEVSNDLKKSKIGTKLTSEKTKTRMKLRLKGN